MFRLSCRTSLVLVAGLALTVPGVAYAAPGTPSPIPTSSVTPTRSPTATPSAPSHHVQFRATVSKQPQQPFDYARVLVEKPQDEGFLLTTSYGHRERFDSFDTTQLDAFVPPPAGGWKPGVDYTVTATPESGPARHVTLRMIDETVELGYRVTFTRPAKPTDPAVLQLHGVEVGDRVQITVSAFEWDGMFAYLETTAQSTAPRYTLRSGDGEHVLPRFDGRWDPALTYLVSIEVGGPGGPDAQTWNQTFRVSESGKPAPTTSPTKAGTSDRQGVDRRGGLAKTGR
jgi:hypothetical protein